MFINAMGVESSPLCEFLVAEEDLSYSLAILILSSILLEFLLMMGIFLKEPLMH